MIVRSTKEKISETTKTGIMARLKVEYIIPILIVILAVTAIVVTSLVNSEKVAEADTINISSETTIPEETKAAALIASSTETTAAETISKPKTTKQVKATSTTTKSTETTTVLQETAAEAEYAERNEVCISENQERENNSHKEEVDVNIQKTTTTNVSSTEAYTAQTTHDSEALSSTATSTSTTTTVTTCVETTETTSTTIPEEEAPTEEFVWDGPVLNRTNGTVQGPSGKETYYNLNMSGVVARMKRLGFEGEYWVRDDGCKMFGDYIMVAANLELRPRGTLVQTSLGMGIVADTGGFASRNKTQLDIATNW